MIVVLFISWSKVSQDNFQKILKRQEKLYCMTQYSAKLNTILTYFSDIQIPI